MIKVLLVLGRRTGAHPPSSCLLTETNKQIDKIKKEELNDKVTRWNISPHDEHRSSCPRQVRL
jgi:hypothetical protein